MLIFLIHSWSQESQFATSKILNTRVNSSTQLYTLYQQYNVHVPFDFNAEEDVLFELGHAVEFHFRLESIMIPFQNTSAAL